MSMPRFYNAPSIPYQNSVFGYEESQTGALVQQTNPEQVFTGSHEDSVGPGQYEVDNSIKPKPGGNWHVSKTQRIDFNSINSSKDSLGPGSYDIKNIQSGNNTHGTSCFLSHVPKSSIIKEVPQKKINDDEEENNKILPGPGQYDPKSGTFDHRAYPGPIQQFGFTAPRFLALSSAKNDTIGPGEYGDFRQNYVEAYLIVRNRVQGKKIFHSFRVRKGSKIKKLLMKFQDQDNIVIKQ